MAKVEKFDSKTHKIQCSGCGRRLASGSFYKSSSNLNKYFGRIIICKQCIYEIFDNYLEKYNNNIRTATYFTCRKIDVAFRDKDYEAALKESQHKNKKQRNFFGIYMTKHSSLGKINNGDSNDFDDSDALELVNHNVVDNSEKNETIDNSYKVKLTHEDKKNKNDVVKLLGYDPFDGYSKYDQKILYNGLIGYLDEDTLEDQFKIGVYIQLLNMELQVKKIDYNISQITKDIDLLLKNSDTLKSLTSVKNTIITTANKLASDNSIAIKHRNDQKAGKSTLGYMLTNLRDLNFEDAEIDYYSQKMCYAMERMAGMSTKAIQENLLFDENDIQEMFLIQREKIQNQEKEILNLEEEVRRAHIEIDKVKTQ